MGFMSRRVIPACICCPSWRPSSKQPVKRYKKLLGEIFPKSLDGPANERKVTKLCEYAARNPFRIPKIAKYLEQRTYRELQSDHVNYIKIILEVYSKLLCICKEQMAYFATSILNVVYELLNEKQQDTLRIIGCRTLTTFIYSQADGTYGHNIEALVSKACMLARAEGDDPSKRCMRIASLECLASMVWFMSTFSHIFTDFDEIVLISLDNYGTADAYCDEDGDGEESPHNWVEAVRSDAGVAMGVGNESRMRSAYSRHQLAVKDSSAVARESETPELWAQICTKKIIEMAKESTTMRRILDPMLTYFDTRKLWDPQRGLAFIVLSDILQFLRDSGMEQVILAPIIRHLDHKKVVHNTQVKSDIIQTTVGLIRQMGSHAAIVDIGIISDLCRHLRKSLQASVELVGLQESNWNTSLQSSIEDCLLEISKGMSDAKTLFDVMTLTLEELPATGVDCRATIGSMLILACILSSAIDLPSNGSTSFFPESLLLQLLKATMHPDVHVRVGVHRIFQVLLVRSACSRKHDGIHFHPEYMYESRRWESRTSAFASATALLKKLRKEKDSGNTEKIPTDIHDDGKEKDTIDEEQKYSRTCKTSPNFHKISCSLACSSSSTERMQDPKIAILSDDQITQLLSAFWIQVNQSDNLPSNYEAIAHSFSLTLLSARLRSSNQQNIIRIFQLPLSIKNICLESDSIPSSCRRSLFVLSLVMLNFGGKRYNIPELCNIVKSVLSRMADPFLSIVDDFQLFVRPHADIKEYGCDTDQMEAAFSLENMRHALEEIDLQILPIIARNISSLVCLEEENVATQLVETFTPEDGFLFGPNSVLDWFHYPEAAHSDESSLDEECSATQSIDGDMADESPAPSELLHSFSNKSTLPAASQVIGVGQLLESALQAAGQVAGTTVSTSPLSYGTLTGHCESLCLGTRRKLSSWLSNNHDFVPEKQMDSLSFATNDCLIKKVVGKEHEQQKSMTESWLSVRLPPASPFDNFLKAARY